MDKTDKFIARLSPKERAWVQQAIADILAKNLSSYDLKKMKGHANLYRIRIGSLRLVFIEGKTDARILLVERRSDTTYRDF